jgi:hypothetical protein
MMQRKRKFQFNRHDCIIRGLLVTSPKDRNEMHYRRPRQRDILVEGIYYAGVREYVSILQIDSYTPQRTGILVEIIHANGRIVTDVMVFNFFTPTCPERAIEGLRTRSNLLRCLAYNIGSMRGIPNVDEFIVNTLKNTGILFSQVLINVIIERTKRWLL